MHRLIAYIAAAVLMITVGVPSELAAEARIVIEVQAGPVDRSGLPVTWSLPERCRDWPNVLLRTAEGADVPAQVLRDAQRRLVWMERAFPAHSVRQYFVDRGDVNATVAAKVRTASDGDMISIDVHGQPLLKYHEPPVAAPETLSPLYRRSGHIHPVVTPKGQIVTDDFCPDHPHQHGIMFAWTNAEHEGRPVNFWEQLRNEGYVEHSSTEYTESGAVCGQFRVRLEHVDLTAPDGGKSVLRETWTVTAYGTPSLHLFDLESVQECVSDSPLIVRQYHYGGLAVRGAREWRLANSGFVTSEGRTRIDGNHTRPIWCAMHGNIESSAAGLIVIGRSSNSRYPQPVRLHPEMPYFCFAPLVLGEFEISRNQPLVSSFRFAAFDGPIDAIFAERLANDWNVPAKIHELPDVGTR